MGKHIQILGDSGRGKSTFAKKLSEKTGIPFYSTDDFYWKTKFTEPNNKQQSIEDIGKIYDQNEWIVEGGTRHLTQKGMEVVDTIYLLEFSNILVQYYFIIRRSLGRKNEKLIDLYKLLKHITYKKYKKGYGNHLPTIREMLKPHKDKVIHLRSLREINNCLDSTNVAD